MYMGIRPATQLNRAKKSGL